MSELQVEVLTPAKVVAKTSAQLVELPGTLGYMGILPGHARLIAELGPGAMKVEGGAESLVYFIAGGYVTVEADKVVVLADAIEKPAEIDVKRAEAAKGRALERLKDSSAIDVERAEAALLRAERRLVVAQLRPN